MDEAEQQYQPQGDHDEPQQAEPFIPPPQPPPPPQPTPPLPPNHEQQQNDNPIPIAYERMQAWLHDQRQIARQHLAQVRQQEHEQQPPLPQVQQPQPDYQQQLPQRQAAALLTLRTRAIYQDYRHVEQLDGNLITPELSEKCSDTTSHQALSPEKCKHHVGDILSSPDNQ